MIWFMISLLLTGTIVLTVCVVYCVLKMKGNNLASPVRKLLSCAIGVTLFNFIAMVSGNEKASLVFFAIYNIFETLTILSLLSFMRSYTGRSGGLGMLRKPLFAAAIIDSVIMAVNPFYKLVFGVEKMWDEFGNTFFRSYDYTLIYTFHTALIVFMVVIVLAMLLHKMFTSPRAYLIKYSSIVITIAVLMALSLFHLYFDFEFDYSIGLYAFEGFIIFYFSMIYVPRGLMDRLMFFTVANMKDGIICVDIDENVVHANVAASDFCAASRDIVTIEEQVKYWHRDDYKKLTTLVWETTRHIGGDKHYFKIEYRQIYDSFMKCLGYFYLIHDKTEEYVKYENEKFRATHDKLTGLYNREHFYELVEKLLKENPYEEYNIIVTDVKNFKIVNDVFGQEKGDEILIKIADVLRKYGGTRCVYARLTGDKFALCIPKRLYSEENLLDCFSVADSFIQNSSFKLHIHIGVYEVKDHGIRVSVMCDHACLAISTIKDSFRSHVAYYDDLMRENFIGDHRIISEFETAISKGQFHVFVQPQVAADGSVRGGESLVRWYHPDDGMIRPDKFIKILENTGLIGRLDKHIWELACIQLKKWSNKGFKKSYLSINISRKDFYLLDVYEEINGLVAKYDIEPSRLHLEVTESAIMDDPTSHLELIQKLRSRGFTVEIDDFGSGYSSLNTLKDLDADVLKIDMGFLQKTTNEEKSKTILRMIISLAKSLDMKVITEGVENPEQVRFLSVCGCDIYQGFYFAKPMAVEDFEKNYLNKRFRMYNENTIRK